ncbi:RNA polymerase sigma factor [Carboxylicivirga marina]|uniref:RNA polymerase sigma-70 factor n=1 Tax=Carboxylicivirga marina TaxID=2800988 RepID=A0ABS1HQP5_9BACT|nr:RNA polymerase sigma-70 factor [Carboxylicivirga marina]MBK3519996.1 RNA polymerase sigma-70 factor [Carboxylicivirga marina]
MNKVLFDIEALRQGDREVFEAIYNEFSDMLYHLCMEYLHDATIAEEIVQDAFVKLWDVREGVRDDLSLRNYLYTITKNNCLMQIRKEQTLIKSKKELKYIEMQFNYEAMAAMADDVLQFDELKSRIDEAIEALPDKLKEVFILSRFDELKYKEIAEQLDVSVKTVEVRISKSLSILRNELKDYLPVIYLMTFILS